jgi:hypothetical protein
MELGSIVVKSCLIVEILRDWIVCGEFGFVGRSWIGSASVGAVAVKMRP